MIVCISHGKGVVGASTYKKMTGQTFADFVLANFNKIFKTCNKKRKEGAYIWLQDGDKCQNSVVAKKALGTVYKNKVQAIPPRSPDLNPIENVFNTVKSSLKKEAIEKSIMKESKVEFEERIRKALFAYSVEKIDKTIESMEGRLKLVKIGRGNRTKY